VSLDRDLATPLARCGRRPPAPLCHAPDLPGPSPPPRSPWHQPPPPPHLVVAPKPVPSPSLLPPGSHRASTAVFCPRASSHHFRAPGSPPIHPRAICPAPVTGAPPPSPILHRITATASILNERPPFLCWFGRPTHTSSHTQAVGHAIAVTIHRKTPSSIEHTVELDSIPPPPHQCCTVSVSPCIIHVA
jgi:hypothetical protein